MLSFHVKDEYTIMYKFVIALLAFLHGLYVSACFYFCEKITCAM